LSQNYNYIQGYTTMKNKVLFLITTYNQLEYTKLCIESLNKVNDIDFDVLVIDDCSNDGTQQWCKDNNIKIIEKPTGKGLTHTWNEGYGVGHNPHQFIGNYFNGLDTKSQDPNNTQDIQDHLLTAREQLKKGKDLYIVDPIRMKHFNGFFFMMSRDICQYEREDGNLFDPDYLMTKNEDTFNWRVLLPADDHPGLCKSAYIFHFKGVAKGSSFGPDTTLEELLGKRK
jgi:GT2 family glycosyltransferase